MNKIVRNSWISIFACLFLSLFCLQKYMEKEYLQSLFCLFAIILLGIGMHKVVRNAWIKFFVCFFGGVFGVHKFVEKKYFQGILYLFTAGLLCIGWLVDTIKYLIAAIKSPKVAAKKNQELEAKLKAAKNGDAESQYALAGIYDRGDGVPSSRKKAAYWMTRSANQGYFYALRDLAAYYQDGYGVSKDINKAIDLLKKAWESTSLWADSIAEELGDIYRYDLHDDDLAMQWYGKAAEKENTSAINKLINAGYYRKYYSSFASEHFKSKYDLWGKRIMQFSSAPTYDNSPSYYEDSSSKTEKHETPWWEEALKEYNTNVYDSQGNMIAYNITEEEARLMGAGEYDDGT